MIASTNRGQAGLSWIKINLLFKFFSHLLAVYYIWSVFISPSFILFFFARKAAMIYLLFILLSCELFAWQTRRDGTIAAVGALSHDTEETYEVTFPKLFIWTRSSFSCFPKGITYLLFFLRLKNLLHYKMTPFFFTKFDRAQLNLNWTFTT